MKDYIFYANEYETYKQDLLQRLINDASIHGESLGGAMDYLDNIIRTHPNGQGAGGLVMETTREAMRHYKDLLEEEYAAVRSRPLRGHRVNDNVNKYDYISVVKFLTASILTNGGRLPVSKESQKEVDSAGEQKLLAMQFEFVQNYPDGSGYAIAKPGDLEIYADGEPVQYTTPSAFKIKEDNR